MSKGVKLARVSLHGEYMLPYDKMGDLLSLMAEAVKAKYDKDENGNYRLVPDDDGGEFEVKFMGVAASAAFLLE